MYRTKAEGGSKIEGKLGKKAKREVKEQFEYFYNSLN